MGNSKNYRIPGPNNTLYEGECNDAGKPHGNGSMRYADRSLFTGNFDNGIPVKGKFEYEDGIVYTGSLK